VNKDFDIEFTRAVHSVIGVKARMHEPFIEDEDRQRAASAEVGEGIEQALLAAALCRETGKGYCLLTSSGTTALHAALVAHGAAEGRKVVIPPVTYAATANAVLATGARLDYGSQKFSRAEWSQECDLSVSLFGYRVATESGIEDACEAFGTKWAGLHVTTVCFSFNQSKIVTAGQGGALLTDDEWVYKSAVEWSGQARTAEMFGFWHQRQGYNARMANINAALLLGQVRRIDLIVEQKQERAEAYRRALEPFDCEVWPIPDGWNAWLVPVTLEDRSLARLVVATLNKHNIEARMSFAPLGAMAPFAGPYDHEEVEWTSRTILLPNGRVK
jgi:perosamine synthetase